MKNTKTEKFMKQKNTKKVDVQKDMLLTKINNIFEQMVDEREGEYVNIQVHIGPSDWDSDKVIRQVLDGEDIESVIKNNCPKVTQDGVDYCMSECENEIEMVADSVDDFDPENSEHYDELVEHLHELQTLDHG